MSEFTRNIETLTEGGGSSPTLRTNTGSLATDTIAAVGFGLDLYRRNRAEKSLKAAKQGEIEYQTRLSEGVLKLRDWRQMQTQNGVSGNAFRRGESKQLKALGDATFQMAVVSETNKLTKQSANEAITALDKAEVARVEAAEMLKTDAFESAAHLGFSVAGIENMTPAQQQSLVMEARVVKAQQAAESTKLALLIQDNTYNNLSEARKTSLYVEETLPKWINDFSSEINTEIELAGGFKGVDKEALTDIVNNKRNSIDATIAQQVVAAREQLGVNISLEQQDAFRQSAESALTGFESAITQDNLNKALAAIPDRKLLQNVVKGLSSPERKVREASLVVTLKLGGNELTGIDMAENFKILAGLYKEDAPALVKDDPEGNKVKVDLAGDSFNTPTMDNNTFSPEQQQNNKTIVNNLLESSNTQLALAVGGGTMDKLVSSIVQQKGMNFDPKDHAAVGRTLATVSARTLSSAIAGAINAPATELVGMGTSARDRIAVDTRTSPNFSLNEDTLQLENLDGSGYVSGPVRRYNRYIADTIKALEVLGVDTTAFKRDAAASVLTAKEKGK